MPLRTPQDPKSDYLDTSLLLANLGAKTASNASITIIAQTAKLVLQIVSIVVLARLLTPEDFGLAAMAAMTTGFFALFRDGGLSMATVQRPEVTGEQVSVLLLLNVVIGLGLTLICVLISPLVAIAFDEPRLLQIMMLASLAFFLAGFGVQHDALLRRQMQFGKIAVIEVSAMFLSVSIAVLLAATGFGYWALILMPLAIATTQTALSWLLCGWRPNLVLRAAGAYGLIKFGLYLTAANIVSFVSINLTPFIISKIGGVEQLGLFNRANSLATIPGTQVLPPIMSVAQPALARLAGDPERFKSSALSLIRKTCLISMFLSVTMFCLAEDLVALLLGEGWSDAADIFRLLSLFAFIEPVATICGMSLIAVGKAGMLLKWKFISLAITLTAIALGANWGVMGIVFSYSASGIFVRMPLFLAYTGRIIGILPRQFLMSILPFVSVTILTGCGIYYAQKMILIENSFLAVLAFTLLSTFIYGFFTVLFSTTRLELIAVFGILRKQIENASAAKKTKKTV